MLISSIADMLFNITHEKPARVTIPVTATNHGLNSSIPRIRKPPQVQRMAFATGAKCQEMRKRASRFGELGA